MIARRLGILGGTFDPIHMGHVDAARAAEAALGLGEVLLVTSHIPPHRTQPAASPYHRFAMVALTVARHPRWRASDLELQTATPSYTSCTLDRLHAAGAYDAPHHTDARRLRTDCPAYRTEHPRPDGYTPLSPAGVAQSVRAAES